MVAFALNQDAEVVRVGSNEDAVEDLVLVTVHELDVFLDEFVIIKRIVDEAFEQILFDDNGLFDDEVVLRNEFVGGCFSDEVGFHFVISQAV